jgi:excisionase family DNA binding protein
MKKTYMSPPEAGDYLGVTTRTIRQMVVDGRLQAYKLGAKVVRLKVDEIDAAMQPLGEAS